MHRSLQRIEHDQGEKRHNTKFTENVSLGRKHEHELKSSTNKLVSSVNIHAHVLYVQQSSPPYLAELLLRVT